MRHSLISLAMVLLTLAALPAAAPAREIKYGVGNWDPESGLGNHRAVVRVEAVAPGKLGVRVRIPWRRRDAEPEKKNIIVIDAATGARIANVYLLAVNREFGDIVFEPKTVPGDYDVYFMPYKSEGRKNYPNVKYDPPQATAEAAWLAATGLAPGKITPVSADAIPTAKVTEIQSTDEFSSFYPMEIIATGAETEALLKANPNSRYLLFPEDRRLSIRMTSDLPQRWAASGPNRFFRGEAAPGEYFTFQIGVWAARGPIEDLAVKFTELKGSGRAASVGPAPLSAVIPASAMTCFNTGGSNWDGSSFKKAVPVGAGKVQALWCGVQVPKEAAPGVYEGTVTVAPRALPETAVVLELRVSGPALEDAGDADPNRMTRLRWLDSRIAFDDGIVPPYTPLKLDGRTISCLGRSLVVGPDGLPARVLSYFTSEMTRFAADAGRTCRLALQGPRGRAGRTRDRLGRSRLRAALHEELGRRRRLGIGERGRRPDDDGQRPDGVRRVRRLQGFDIRGARSPGLRYPARDPVQRGTRELHDGSRLQGRAQAGLVRMVMGPEEEPGRPLDRERQRGPAGLPPGRELFPPAQHELLPVQASQHAALLVELGQGRRLREDDRPRGWRDGLERVQPCRRRQEGRRPPGRPLRAADRPGRRNSPLRFHPPPHALQAPRPGGPFRPALLPRLQAPGRGGRIRGQRHQHPPRERHQPLHQLSLPAAAADEGLHRRRPTAAASRSRSTTRSASSPTTRPSSSPCGAWGTRSSRPAPAGAPPGSRSTSAPTTSRPGSCPSSRTRPSSTAACPAGTITTSRASTGWPETSASTASTSTMWPSTGRP